MQIINPVKNLSTLSVTLSVSKVLRARKETADTSNYLHKIDIHLVNMSKRSINFLIKAFVNRKAEMIK